MIVDAEYPNVTCDVHQITRPAYAVCVHAARGEQALKHEPPTETEVGVLLCPKCEVLCAGHSVEMFDNLLITCALCVARLLPGQA